jgi:hypothetical protein
VSIVRWNLKEAGGKVPNRRTETAYKAVQGGRACVTKRSPILPEPCDVNAAVTWDEGYSPLPGEVLQTAYEATDEAFRRVRTYAVMYS